MKTEQGLQIAEILFDKSYGDVSEYKAKIERLKAENDSLNKKISELEQDLIHADENVFYRECDVKLAEDKIKKQAQIDVLNKLKRIMTAYSWQIDINDVQKEINKLIKEVENDEEDRPHSQTLVESLNTETKELMLSLYCKQMQRAVEQQYLEDAHVTADSILCELLTLLGCDKVVEIYNTLPKMYS